VAIKSYQNKNHVTNGLLIQKENTSMNRTISNLTLFVFLSVAGTWFGCGDDSGTSPTSPEAFNIRGTWELTSITGAPSVNGSNSTWNFKADGTYDWFLLLQPFDLLSEGDYSLSGSTLTVTGFIRNVTGTDKISITVSNNNNTFSLRDSDGLTWIYNRAQ
jgi:hypothetical protein